MSPDPFLSDVDTAEIQKDQQTANELISGDLQHAATLDNVDVDYNLLHSMIGQLL